MRTGLERVDGKEKPGREVLKKATERKTWEEKPGHSWKEKWGTKSGGQARTAIEGEKK